MNDSKNLILAVALSALVLLGWSWAANKYFPTANPPAAKMANGKQQGVPAPGEAQPIPAKPKATMAQALGSSPRVSIRTPTLLGSINLKGAQIDDLQLVRQTQTINRNSPPVRLLSPLGTPDAYIATFGWTAQPGEAPSLDSLWTADNQNLTPGHPITLTSQSDAGTRFQIRISVDDGYLFTIQQSVTNAAGQPLSLRTIGLVSRAAQSTDKSIWTNHVGPIGVFNGKVDYSINWKDLDAGKTESFDNSGWLGFTDKYWLTALVPQGSTASTFRRASNGGYQADFESAPVTVNAGQTVTSNVRFFAGVKEKALLDRYEKAGVPLLSYAIDWGWFWFFARPIFDLLLFLFHAAWQFRPGNYLPHADCARSDVPNCSKAVPIDGRDAQATAENEGHPGAVQGRQAAPAAGDHEALPGRKGGTRRQDVFRSSCKFRSSMRSTKRSSSAWKCATSPLSAGSRTLSAPDPLTPVNLFGLLHFTPPAMLAIGVLPILVGATQWTSMKLNPQPMDPAQAQMFAIMPWFLVFIMAPFAAGLQLYWITNNLLTIAQQWFLYRKFGLHLSDTHPVHT